MDFLVSSITTTPTTTTTTHLFECISRDYSKYSFTPPLPEGIHISALSLKLFHEDTIAINVASDGTIEVKIEHSPIRDGGAIYGTLILQGNRTFGRTKSKFFYQCVPHSRKLPVFFIPVDPPTAAHSKYIRNRYVAFEFREWDAKHPSGALVKTFGEVNSYPAFVEYTLNVNQLNASITPLTNHLSKILLTTTNWNTIMDDIIQADPRIQDRRNIEVISIDPPSCVDIDDAFSITHNGAQSSTLSIYISNVPKVLDMLDAWRHLSRRTSSIYLPDSRVPMLPLVLSENFCSLLEGQSRLAIAFDFSLIDGTMIEPTAINMCVIRVAKNYHYEDSELQTNSTFMDALYFVSSQTPAAAVSGAGAGAGTPPLDSHALVEWMMIRTNQWVANQCVKLGRGILRGFTLTNTQEKDAHCLIDSADDTPEFRRFLQGWNSEGGCYVLIQEAPVLPTHSLIVGKNGTPSFYTHASSPIRRMVDLINLTIIQQAEELISSLEAEELVSRWMTPRGIDWIQQSSKAIRKTQNECSLMFLLTNSAADSPLLKEAHTGVILSNEFAPKHGTDGFNYGVYLFDLGRVFYYWSADELAPGWRGSFRFFKFEDTDRIASKLRIHHVI